MTWGVGGCLVLSYDVILEGTGDWGTKHGSSTGRSMKHIRLAGTPVLGGTFVWLALRAETRSATAQRDVTIDGSSIG